MQEYPESNRGDQPQTSKRLHLSFASAAIALAIILFPLSDYVAYASIALAIFSGIYFLIAGNKDWIESYWQRLLLPFLPFFISSILLLSSNSIGGQRIGLFLLIGSSLLSLAFSRTSHEEQRGGLLYSFLIAFILTIWRGVRDYIWSADPYWQTFDSLPFEISTLFILLYLFGNFLFYAPRIFLLLCIQFNLSRTLVAFLFILLTCIWVFFFILLFKYAHTLILLAIFPFIFIPHVRKWINYFRNLTTRLSLWVIVVIAFLFGVSFVAHLIDNYFSPQYKPSSPFETITANGRPYSHDTTTYAFLHGKYPDIYVSQEEIVNEWTRYSGIPLQKEFAPGRTIYFALCNYLASAGYRRDSIGLSNLSQEDIEAIEMGATDIHLKRRGWLYWKLWRELEDLDYARASGNITNSYLLMGWLSISQADTQLTPPIGFIAASRRWGLPFILFFIGSILAVLIYAGWRKKHQHAWAVLSLFLIAITFGHGAFTRFGMFYIMMSVWWATHFSGKTSRF